MPSFNVVRNVRLQLTTVTCEYAFAEHTYYSRDCNWGQTASSQSAVTSRCRAKAMQHGLRWRGRSQDRDRDGGEGKGELRENLKAAGFKISKQTNKSSGIYHLLIGCESREESELTKEFQFNSQAQCQARINEVKRAWPCPPLFSVPWNWCWNFWGHQRGHGSVWPP